MYQRPFPLLLDEHIGLLSFERVVPWSFTCCFHEVISDHSRVAIKLNSRLQLIQARGFSALKKDTQRVLHYLSVIYSVRIGGMECADGRVKVLDVSFEVLVYVSRRHLGFYLEKFLFGIVLSGSRSRLDAHARQGASIHSDLCCWPNRQRGQMHLRRSNNRDQSQAHRGL